MVLSAALDSGYVFLSLVAILTSVVGAVYVCSLITIMPGSLNLTFETWKFIGYKPVNLSDFEMNRGVQHVDKSSTVSNILAVFLYVVTYLLTIALVPLSHVKFNLPVNFVPVTLPRVMVPMISLKSRLSRYIVSFGRPETTSLRELAKREITDVIVRTGDLLREVIPKIMFKLISIKNYFKAFIGGRSFRSINLNFNNYNWEGKQNHINRFSSLASGYKLNLKNLHYLNEVSIFKTRLILNITKECAVKHAFYGLRFITYLRDCQENAPEKATTITQNILLSPWFITGFTDAEGSFGANFRRSTTSTLGMRFQPVMAINLHKKDIDLLNKIRAYFGNVGFITIGEKSASFRVQSLKEISANIIPHFDKYPLISKKQADYLLFREIVMIMERKEHLSKEGLQSIVNIKATLNLGLSEDLKVTFPETKPVARPVVSDPKISNPEWIAGFTSFSSMVSNHPFSTTRRELCIPLISGILSRAFRANTNALLKKTGIKQFSSKSTNNHLSVVVWGTNLTSTVGIGRFTKQVRDMISLPVHQKSIIVGLILSDGWLRFPSKTSKSALLGLTQSLDHSGYIWFVFFNLSHYCNNSPVYRLRKRGENFFTSIEFVTRSLPCFTELYFIFYKNGIKIIPYNIYELLTPEALSHLIMGDGYARPHGLIICTDSYSVQDVVRLINVLMVKYRLICTLRYNSIYPRIYISERSMPLLRTIVRPHMHSSMIYKIKSLESKAHYTTGSLAQRENFLVSPSRRLQELWKVGGCGKGSRDLPLDPWFITGFIEGQNCFSVNIQKPTTGRDWVIKHSFNIHSRGKEDEKILKLIQIYFTNCARSSNVVNKEEIIGSIYKTGKDRVCLSVNSLQQIYNVLIPHFDQYPVITKIADYLTFKKVIGMLVKKEYLTDKGLERIIALNAVYSKEGLPLDKLKAVFPDTISVTRSLLPGKTSPEIPHPEWIAGFTSVMGSFSVSLYNAPTRKLGVRLLVRFIITQHSRDEYLMKSLVKYFDCGYYTSRATRECGEFVVSNISDITEKIIPFFLKYKIRGIKFLDFQDWSQIVELMIDDKGLTQKKLDQILKIKSGMNKGRK